MSFPLPHVPLLLALGILCAAGDVDALVRTRNFNQNATGACQAALPVFEGEIRKRPLAVQNEGDASAFVTCSLVSTTAGVGGNNSMWRVFMGAANLTAGPLVLNCTLVDGPANGTAEYFPKSITLPANSTLNGVAWTAVDDNAGVNFRGAVNLSCSVPVGVGITTIFSVYDEDVGT